MITDAATSLNKLKQFFDNQLTVLEIPELIRMENTNTGNEIWNALILNETNDKLQKINFKSMEQFPYIITGTNITEVNFEQLKQVEVSDNRNSSLRSIAPRFLQNTKIQKLNLPNFIGSASPTSRINTDIGSTDVAHTSFWNNYWLADVVLGNSHMKQADYPSHVFNGFWFRNNYFLNSLRLYYPYVIPIEGVGGLSSTPLGRNNGNGYIYVPDDLVLNYQRTTGWSAFDSKIRGLSQYIDVNMDTITDDWATIAGRCASGDTSIYNIGDTKSVEIDGIKIQFILVGKNQDELYDSITNYNPNYPNRAALSWQQRTIAFFSPQSIANSFANSNQTSYTEDITFHKYLYENIYEKISNELKPYIRPVIKYSTGYNEGAYRSNVPTKTAAQNPTYLEYVWPFSAFELGIGQPVTNTFRYNYHDRNSNPNAPILNFYLGDTLNNTDVSVALRDYSEGRSAPDCLVPSSTAGASMTVSTSNHSHPYLIVGFCT